MLTAGDLIGVALFTSLLPSGRAHVAGTTADIQLGTGEFAVHEGGEPDLYVVLAFVHQYLSRSA